MMSHPCEHCGNKDKSKWTTQCLYKGDWPSRRAFVRSTFDPPCAGDAYDEGQNQRARRGYLIVWSILIGMVAIGGLIAWLSR